jgi:AcrR family transcriptional regulator
VVETASRLLSEPQSVANFSMEAVAKAAGVTRLTVYKQFGSRRRLMEAVFDARAEAGGLGRIAEAMALSDPRASLDMLVEIFCRFYASDASIGRLHDEAGLDAEFAMALDERRERGRRVLTVVAERAAPDADPERRREAVDLMFGLIGMPMFRTLREGRTDAQACAVLKTACADVLGRLMAAPPAPRKEP